ncbi:TPA: hypothetical protein LU182_004163 [Enterobacter hormaechei subsp. xiangfangensis]|nr:hypothetical protein [Enterobacter hormaechei subsp. xiangfangensis]HBM2586926.1 hypothetical protein [Enterobacter hormaechei subsp. xiangfangensis]HBM2870996.1 hypothetical protein [Enterobacter hormaechei subsp. xiangfangensis]HBM2875213.1 hypothetical protein [Enterobacter hormaechei subsp. xiangfangensis]
MPKFKFEDCAATGAGHFFVQETIPSEFFTGVEGGTALVVNQCKYCGINEDEVQDEQSDS